MLSLTDWKHLKCSLQQRWDFEELQTYFLQPVGSKSQIV